MLVPPPFLLCCLLFLMIQCISLLFLDVWQKLLSFTHLSTQLLCCCSSGLHLCRLLLHTIMPLSVAVLYHIGYRRLIPRLLEQPKMMAPRGTSGSLCLPYSSSVCSLPVDLPWTGRRSLLCRVAPLCPVWVVPPPPCPTVSSSIRACTLVSLSAGHSAALTHSAPAVTEAQAAICHPPSPPLLTMGKESLNLNPRFARGVVCRVPPALVSVCKWVL